MGEERSGQGLTRCWFAPYLAALCFAVFLVSFVCCHYSHMGLAFREWGMDTYRNAIVLSTAYEKRRMEKNISPFISNQDL